MKRIDVDIIKLIRFLEGRSRRKSMTDQNKVFDYRALAALYILKTNIDYPVLKNKFDKKALYPIHAWVFWFTSKEDFDVVDITYKGNVVWSVNSDL